MRIASLIAGLSLLGLCGPARAQGCEAPDAFEPNDACAAATAFVAGSHVGLTVQGAAAAGGVDADHYAVNVASGNVLLVDAFFSNASGDVDLELFGDPACTQLVDASYSQTDDEHVEFVNDTGLPVALVLVVRGYGPSFACNDYDLLVAIVPDPCVGLLPDAAEDDDVCSTAAPLYGGLTSGLNVSASDPDWRHITLDGGATLALELRFTHAEGDLDLRLWGGCPTTGLVPLATSESETDDEFMGFGNSGDLPVDLWIEVYVWAGSSSSCNDYELFADLDGGAPAIPVCFGDGTGGVGCPCGNLGAAGEGCANSTGSGAVLSATGTRVFANDDLVLHVSGARPNQPGMALQGGALVPQPFRDGILCLGPPTERIELIFLDEAGAATTSVSIATEGGIAGPGTTAWYQAWFRDPQFSVCGTGSNLSQALQVDWN